MLASRIRRSRFVSLIVLIAGVVLLFAVFGWFTRVTAANRFRWRLPLGLVSIGLLFAGILLAVRGKPLFGASLVVVAIIAGVSARIRPPARRRTTGQDRDLSNSEARAVLGVGREAGPQEIRAAYDRLIRRIHPDAGGTDGLAAQLNAARDKLLGRS
jgi:hypothetical protein